MFNFNGFGCIISLGLLCLLFLCVHVRVVVGFVVCFLFLLLVVGFLFFLWVFCVCFFVSLFFVAVVVVLGG